MKRSVQVAIVPHSQRTSDYRKDKPELFQVMARERHLLIFWSDWRIISFTAGLASDAQRAWPYDTAVLVRDQVATNGSIYDEYLRVAFPIYELDTEEPET